MDSREYTFDGTEPAVHETASVGHESALVGDVSVGADVTVRPGAVLNDSHVAANALVGFNATVSEATVGAGSIVAMGTVIPPGYDVAPESFVRGTTPQVTPLSETDIDPDDVFTEFASGEYAHLTDGHEGLFE